MAEVTITIKTVDENSGVLSAVEKKYESFANEITKGTQKSALAKQGATGLTSSLGGLNKVLGAVGIPALGWTAAIGGTVAVAKKALDATMKYGAEVRDLSFITGTGAEKTSRLIQVLDDYEISAQDAEVATKALTKNGYVPTVETLAELSDRYLALNSDMEKNEFILKNLGKGGLQWVNFLSQGGEKILELNDSVDKNLILTDKQSRLIEEGRLEIDRAKDTVEGWKYAGVTAFLELKDKSDTYYEALGNLGERHNATAVQMGYMVKNSQELRDELQDEIFSLEHVGLSLGYQTEAVRDSIKATKEATVDYAELLKFGQALTKSNEAFTESQSKVKAQFDDSNFVAELYKQRLQELTDANKDGELSDREFYNAKVDLNRALKDGTFAAQEQQKALADLEDAQDKQGAALLSSLLEQKGASDELKTSYAVASGQISKGAVDQEKAISKIGDALMAGKLTADEAARAINDLTGDLSALDGMSVSAYVDLFIKTHGALPGAGVGTGKGLGGFTGGVQQGFASGGNVPWGILGAVGERGEEGISVSKSGDISIIPAPIWKKMKDYGVMPETGYAVDPGGGAGGGGGGSAGGHAGSGTRRPRGFVSGGVIIGTSQQAQTETQTGTSELHGAISELSNAVTKLQSQGLQQKPGVPMMTDLSARTIRNLANQVAMEVAKVTG